MTALHNRFETVGEALEIRSRLKQLYGDKEPAGVLTALDHFGYSLRALLHRDDSMGMSASIEARFPFLDSNIVRFGLNIPYRTKLRFSTSARRDPVHPFYYDKWILRQVAKRYLPDSLSQREKKPFPVIAYHPGYFEVKPQFLKNSFVRQMFGLTDRELDHLVNHASHDLKWKMFQLEVWVETCLMGQPGDAVMQRLQPNLSVLRVA